MDSETVICIIAQNGLDTAGRLFEVKAVSAEKKAAKTEDAKEKARLTKEAKKYRKLVAILSASEAGLADYLASKGEN